MPRKTIQRSPNCDKALNDVLDDIVDKAKDCIVLVDHDVQKDKIILTYDDAKCVEAKE